MLSGTEPAAMAANKRQEARKRLGVEAEAEVSGDKQDGPTGRPFNALIGLNNDLFENLKSKL